MSDKACNLNEPHDCVNVRAANDALRRHLNRACDARDANLRRIAALLRRNRTLEARLARVLQGATFAHNFHVEKGMPLRAYGGVWSRKRTGGGR